eukprot:GFYU01003529.1.p1 GENE.GFYU01003529.1~~GFYU01003529.1.p1  ORF type:complete len:394 (+),score=69.79 GFYU01003529.1:178-1359(+)
MAKGFFAKFRRSSEEEKAEKQKEKEIIERRKVRSQSRYSVTQKKLSQWNGPIDTHEDGMARLSDTRISVDDHSAIKTLLKWDQRPQSVLIIKKHNDPEATVLMHSMAETCQKEYNIRVFVEKSVAKEFNGCDVFDKNKLECCDIDLVITLGGDGTILHAMNQFEESIPPTLPFHMGSLGFLANFGTESYKDVLYQVFEGENILQLRMRLDCEVWKNGHFTEVHRVLNEVVIDRGPGSFLSNLQCFVDGEFFTTVAADGIIVATPTGSTAYSMSAGGSMVHPSVPGILFTPICPHTLSFRPILLPDYVEIKIKVPQESRGSAWAAFDGRHRVEITKEDAIVLRMSKFPVPAIIKDSNMGDWVNAISQGLHWNQRAHQKAFSPPPPSTPMSSSRL